MVDSITDIIEVPPVRAAYLADAVTGEVLYSVNSDKRFPNASTTKIMSLYLIYESIARGNISIDDIVTISEHAAKANGSTAKQKAGERMSVRDLIKSMIVASANDSARAMAEFVCGTEADFIKLMNERAAELKLKNSHFNCPVGWGGTQHYMSARDIASLAAEFVTRFPEILEYSSMREVTVTHITDDGEYTGVLKNTNLLLGKYKGIVGLKTGAHIKAKCCFCGFARRNGVSLVSVVLGAETHSICFGETKKLLNFGFANVSAKT